MTGATGYVGGRLIPLLLARGYRVRVLVRDADRLEGRSWRDQVEVAVGDVLDPATLPAALDGVDAAYYLIHSMSRHADFAQRDLPRRAAFAEAAAAQGVARILYLGGLGRSETGLSEHLRSRQETGAALREAGVPVTELRASILVGSGSVSFEMIRNLTERLPVMICPRWVYTRTQPIAIDDALAYLVAALETPESQGQIIEIGGRDVLTYREMMLTYARLRGLRRFIIPVPVLTPRLSSYWVHLVTPIPSTIAQPLIEGLSVEVIVTDDRAHRLFPTDHPDGLRDRRGAGPGEPGSQRRRNELERRPRQQPGRYPPLHLHHPGWDAHRTAAARGRRAARDRLCRVCRASAAAKAGSRATACGVCAARPTGSSGAWGSAGGGATRSTCGSGTPSISGASKPSRPVGWFGCGRR